MNVNVTCIFLGCIEWVDPDCDAISGNLMAKLYIGSDVKRNIIAPGYILIYLIIMFLTVYLNTHTHMNTHDKEYKQLI